MTAPLPELAPHAYSIPQAATVLGIGRTLAWRMVHDGEIPSVRIGGRVLVPRYVVDDLLSQATADRPKTSPPKTTERRV